MFDFSSSLPVHVDLVNLFRVVAIWNTTCFHFDPWICHMKVLFRKKNMFPVGFEVFSSTCGNNMKKYTTSFLAILAGKNIKNIFFRNHFSWNYCKQKTTLFFPNHFSRHPSQEISFPFASLAEFIRGSFWPKDEGVVKEVFRVRTQTCLESWHPKVFETSVWLYGCRKRRRWSS